MEDYRKLAAKLRICHNPDVDCDGCEDEQVEGCIHKNIGLAADAIENLLTENAALRQQERFGEVNKALTLDELSERNAPVFLPIKEFPNGGYWCLCQNGYIIPPSGCGFIAKDRPNFVFYRQKPEEGTD